jgi:hypothetical protein
MENNQAWPFDQAPNVAAITTRQVVELNYPIRQVVHYSDNNSWAFTCGTTEDEDDYRLVHMEDILILDESLRSIADLPPGWSAWRENKESTWERMEDDI